MNFEKQNWKYDLTEIVRKIYNGEDAYQYEGLDEIISFVSSLLQKEREAIVKKIERMKKTCGLVAHTEPCKHYGVDLYNSALADLIQLIQGEDL